MMEKRLTVKELQKLKTFCGNNDKIETIKYFRSITAYELKEYKEIIDSCFKDNASLNNFEYEAIKKTENNTQDIKQITEQNIPNNSLSESKLNSIQAFLQKSQKINAAKLVKEKLNINLKRSKRIY